MSKQVIVVGHRLQRFGYGRLPSKAKCSCGHVSATMSSTAARQGWHRWHKQSVLDARHG